MPMEQKEGITLADDLIIVIDRIEEAEDRNGKTYLKITDKAGVTRNFKEGRAKLLTNKGHLLEEGKAIKLHFEDYTTPEGKVFPFVKNFESVEDEFVKQATEKVQTKAKDTKEGSIEAQVSQKGGIEVLKVLIDMGKLNEAELQECAEYAMSSVRWGMGRIDLPSVIVDKIEEAKSETIKTDKDSQETQSKLTDRQDSGEAIKTAGELFNWIMSKDKGIKSPRVWVNTEFGVGDKEILTDEKVQELYLKIKEKKGW